MDLNERKLKFSETRTIDVVTDKSFKQLLLDDKLIKRMKSVGFCDPTPVQTGAIPVGLLGNGLIIYIPNNLMKLLFRYSCSSKIWNWKNISFCSFGGELCNRNQCSWKTASCYFGSNS